VRIFFALFVMAFSGVICAPAKATDNLQGWGVVILHGKSGPGRALEPVAAALRGAGAKVVAPTMSWANGYRTYEDTLDEISSHIAALRSRGAKHIALVGQSIGANVALGYGARRPGVEAIIAISPGHQPDRFLRFTQDSLTRAKQMIADGRGKQVAQFSDVNQGQAFQTRTTAEAYVSFFDPDGPALMRRNAADLKGAKLLWVVGSRDKAARAVVTGGTVINVEGDHRQAGSIAARKTVAWLSQL
jgi:pimeloyl-ACP methyl ester carboxylesterase